MRHAAAGVISATNRLQKLLTAKDKKQCILDMAAANEIDLALIQLLQQNIDGARAAGREDVAGASSPHLYVLKFASSVAHLDASMVTSWLWWTVAATPIAQHLRSPDQRRIPVVQCAELLYVSLTVL